MRVLDASGVEKLPDVVRALKVVTEVRVVGYREALSEALEAFAPDVVVMSPYLPGAAPFADALWAVRKAGVRVVLLVGSGEDPVEREALELAPPLGVYDLLFNPVDSGALERALTSPASPGECLERIRARTREMASPERLVAGWRSLADRLLRRAERAEAGGTPRPAEPEEELHARPEPSVAHSRDAARDSDSDSEVPRDALTGLPTRASAERRIEILLAEGARFSVLMMDLDGFKATNDRLGHRAGDELLRRAARAWRGVMRETDELFRWAGDEFLVVTQGKSAAGLVERLREAAASAGLGVSIGAAEARRKDTVEALVDRADRAMYADKEARRRAVTEGLTVFVGVLPRAGTTTAAVAWALAHADAGRRAALVEASERPALSLMLGLRAQSPGWDTWPLGKPPAELALETSGMVVLPMARACADWSPGLLERLSLAVEAARSVAALVAVDLGSFPPLQEGSPDPRLRWAFGRATRFVLCVPQDLPGVEAAARWLAALGSAGVAATLVLTDPVPALGTAQDVAEVLRSRVGGALEEVIEMPWEPAGVRVAYAEAPPPVRLVLPEEARQALRVLA